jgi:hypothetical protein
MELPEAVEVGIDPVGEARRRSGALSECQQGTRDNRESGGKGDSFYLGSPPRHCALLPGLSKDSMPVYLRGRSRGNSIGVRAR